MSTITNGQIRKSLASQLDRLDGILDGLAEGLNEAVATAVQETVGVAVQAAVTEVLTNPELQSRLRQGLKDPISSNPVVKAAMGIWALVKAGCAKVAGWLAKAYSHTIKAACGCKEATLGKVVNACNKAKTTVKGLWMRTLLALTLAKKLRKALLAALAAGITIGLGCYFSGPVVSSLFSGFAGFVGSLAAVTMKTLRGLLGTKDLAGT
jgi:hypothetical protein